MEEKDRWSVHLEYLKMAIALATALIGAGAAIYVDSTKIPSDNSRYLLLTGIGVFSVTLFCSVYSIACLANHFLHLPRAGNPDPAADAARLNAERTTRASSVVWWASASFIFLGLGVAVLGVFFGVRTFTAGTPFDQAVTTANAASARLIDSKNGESEKLRSVEVQTDMFRVTYDVHPGGGSIIVITDSSGANLKSATR